MHCNCVCARHALKANMLELKVGITLALAESCLHVDSFCGGSWCSDMSLLNLKFLGSTESDADFFSSIILCLE